MSKKISVNWSKVKEVSCPSFVPIHRDDLWREKGWEVRQEGDKFYFEFLVSRHGGGTDIYEITKEEFEGVKTSKVTYDDLIQKYDQGPYHPIGSR